MIGLYILALALYRPHVLYSASLIGRGESQSSKARPRAEAGAKVSENAIATKQSEELRLALAALYLLSILFLNSTCM